MQRIISKAKFLIVLIFIGNRQVVGSTPTGTSTWCCSRVVMRRLGKAESVSSILTITSIDRYSNLYLCKDIGSSPILRAIISRLAQWLSIH